MKRYLLLIAMALALVPCGWAASGNITTNGSDCSVATRCLVVNLPSDKGGSTLTLSGTWTGTIQFEATGDGGTMWTGVSVVPLGSTTPVTSTTSNGTWQVNMSGFTGIRMRSSASMTGTAVATITPSAAPFAQRVNPGSGGVGNANYTGTLNTVACGTGTAHTLADCTAGALIGTPTGGVKGAGTLNATNLYVNGTAVSIATPPTIATTPNVLKGDNAGNAVASSIVDNGTNATSTPNGLDTGNNGTGNAVPPGNDNPGTVVNELACYSSAHLATVCPTSTTSGVLGVVVSGAGNSGTPHICMTLCPVIVDGTSVIGDWLIPSTTVAGDVHDTGLDSRTTASPAGTQSFVADSVATVGTNVLAEVYTPYQTNAGGGGANPGGVSLEFNGSLSKKIANVNSTTPAAQANNINATVQSSNSGNTTSASVEIPITGNAAKAVSATSLPGSAGAAVCDDGAGNIKDSGCSSGGVTSVGLALPSNIFTVTGSPVTSSGTLTGAFNSQTAGYVLQSPATGTQQGFKIQTHACPVSSAGTSTTCAYTSAVAAADELVVWDCFNNNAASSATDTLGNTFVVHGSVGWGSSTNCSILIAPSPSGGADTITVTGSTLGTGFVLIMEYAGIKSSSEFDAISSLGSSTGCNAGNTLKFSSVTTTNANDIIIAFAMDRNSTTPNFQVGDGYRLDQPTFTDSQPSGVAAASANVASTGAYVPFMTAGASNCSGGDLFNTGSIALKLATSGGSNSIVAAPISVQTLNAGGLFIPVISYNATATGQTAAITDTNMIASVPVTQLYNFVGTVNCTTTSAAAVATLNLKYTDSGSAAQTVSVSDTCTSLVTSGVPNLNVALRAKAGTAITWGVTITNTPNYDVDVRLVCFNGATC